MNESMTHTNRLGKCIRNLDRQMVFMAALGLCLALSTEAFCDEYKELAESSSKYFGFIFSPAIRKTVFAMGFGWGIINSFMKSSFIPFLTYTGLGATYNFTPSIVNLLSNM